MSATPERITLRKIWSDFLEQLNLERGLGYTIKRFLLHPGKAVEEYLYQNRDIYMKPFSFLLLTSAVTTFLMVQYVIDGNREIAEEFNSPEWQRIPELLQPGLEWLRIGFYNYFNLMYLSSLPAVALASFWIFRRKFDYNFAEHFVINTYIFSIQSILYLFNIPFLATESKAIWAVLPSSLIVIYFLFAYKKIFQLNFRQVLGYCLLIYVLAQLLSLVLLALVVLAGMFFA